MNIAYFDILSGVSGNMILGALIDAGVSIDYLKTELLKLDIASYEIVVSKELKHKISGTLLTVKIDDSKQPNRNFISIEELISKSSLSDRIKNKSISIFKKIAEAEAKIHNIPENRVHFHEVGAVDAIVDIVGTVICMDYLKLDRIYSSPPVLGTGGWINSSHGKLPNPAPAVLELLKNIPCRNFDLKEELTTPTGASILALVVDEFCSPPEMFIQKVGYGAGSKNFDEIPNFLRIIIGEAKTELADTDYISVIETNIDNMNPEHYDWLIDEVLKKGALDIFLTPIIMKKSRAAVCITILTDPCVEKKITEFMLKYTPTFGVRISSMRREKLIRKMDKIETKYGLIGIKSGYLDGKVIKVSLEYEDIKKIAIELEISPQEIINEVNKLIKFI